jgi:hypothetical protein
MQEEVRKKGKARSGLSGKGSLLATAVSVESTVVIEISVIIF